MSEEQNNSEEGIKEPETPKKRRRWLSVRSAAVAAGVIAAALLVLMAVAFILYRAGYSDNYIKSQFVSKMNEIGVVFDADVFRLTLSPLELQLRNATFNDQLTGEKLFFVRDARLGLSVSNLWSWQLSRDISIDKTEINGAEVWVRFDENGRSNFANIKLVEDQPEGRVKFKYESMNFALRDSTLHFGDISRKIDADANNLALFMEPEDLSVPDVQKRYKVNFSSNDSKLVYDGNELRPIDIKAVGIADRMGAEISEFRLTTPVGESLMSGTLSDWASLKYDLNIESNVDLTQTSTIFPLGTTLRGVGNFKGKVSGEGENYRVDGTIDSQSLTAEGIYLKGVNVAATVEGTNSAYKANGTAVAELLTFEDFRIEFPRVAGNVRGTGTDFRWVGELQAAAVRSKGLNIAGLFLSDAVAEMKDKRIMAEAAAGRAQKFSIAENEFTDLRAQSLRFAQREGGFDLTAPSAQADQFKTEDYTLNGISGSGVKVSDRPGTTEVKVDKLKAETAHAGDARLRNITADQFVFADRPNSTDLAAKNLRADQLNADGTVITGLEVPSVTLKDTQAETVIYSDNVRVAKIDAGSAVLGTMNIAGVRLTIRQGRVEARSNDIDAGTVTLTKSDTLQNGGTLSEVKIAKPVFILEPSGRYRASADMSLGGGTVGNIPLGAATSRVEVTNGRVDLKDLNAQVMEGNVAGNASLALNKRGTSSIQANFTELDLAKVAALQGGSVLPLEGKTNGSIDLTMAGTDHRTISGKVIADITANAGDNNTSKIPINGNIRLSATDGLFNVDNAKLATEQSELTAAGRFDLKNQNSDLNLALNSKDAGEIERIIRIFGISPTFEQEFDAREAEVEGDLVFNGRITGNLTDPVIEGKASLEMLSLRGTQVGSISTDLNVDPLGVKLSNGLLNEVDGGTIAFAVDIPAAGTNNIAVKATLNNINAGRLLAAIPADLPAQLRGLNGKTSGTIDLAGLPDNSQGRVDLKASQGVVAGQNFDALRVNAIFQGTRIDLREASITVNGGTLDAVGNYDTASTAFDLDLKGSGVPLALAVSLAEVSGISSVDGTADFTAKAIGRTNDRSSFNINFSGSAFGASVNGQAFGSATFKGNTAGQVLIADVNIDVDGRPQTISGSLNFGDPNMPFGVQTEFNNTPLAPYFALIPQLQGMGVTGSATGRVTFGGNLMAVDPATGTSQMSKAGLSGSAEFSQLSLQIQDTPLNAVEPVRIRFSPREVIFDAAKFSGGGSNMSISGTKAIADDARNSLNISGRVNLALLNIVPQIREKDTFFAGYADVLMSMEGINKDATLSGTADIQNASIGTFINSDRIKFDRLQGRLLFNSNQVQIERLTGHLGGGQFVANGGVLLGNRLEISSFRLSLDGRNMSAFVRDFNATADAKVEISGRSIGSGLSMLVSGNIIARRVLYSTDIELANIVGARRDTSLSGGGGSSLFAPRLDLTIEGRDALIVQNNLADLTASVSLRVTGSTDSPQVAGRITAGNGTVFFRRDRYVVQRGVLEFPPNTQIDPIINLQAESEIAGYQVFVNLSGPLTDTADLNASVRSSPALPQADVISLITTGSLTNADGGIPTFAQTGINTAAEILTDSIINNPARKATDKLFGLNVFEIDPIISGDRMNPSARLTVGRQVNNNLRVTYATNLSQDQNQVLAFEYRVSNKISLVAQYEQRPLGNVTQNRNNFTFEVRFRRRF